VGGDFGRVRVDYEVTAPASGTLRVLEPAPKKERTTASQSAAEIYAASLDAAAGPRGSAAWDGRTAAGAPAPEGAYVLRLDLRSADGAEAHLEAPVELAAGSAAPLAGQASGVSGLQYVATPDVAEPGTGAFTFMSGLLLESGSAIESAPVVLALRHGLSPGLELDATVGAFLVGEPPLPYLLAVAVKRALSSPAPAVSLAATARASLQDGTGSDPLTAFTGLGLGLAAGVRAGPLLLTFEPELTASPWRVTGDDTYADDPAFNVWAYLRAGVAARLPDFTVGLSAAARTEPFADGAGLATPLALAAEARWSPAPGRLAIGLWAGAQVSPGAVDQLLVAADFGYRY
jgi:hypothetical protein